MPKKLYLYCDTITGDLARVTKKDSKRLPPHWKLVQFIKNDKGEQVMRFNFDGATVDVQENGTTEVEPVSTES